MKNEAKAKRKSGPAAVPQEAWLLEQLADSELAAAYLNAALDEGDQAAFMLALRNVAKARGGVSGVARQSGLNRVSLNRALSARGNPELHSLNRILEATGFKLLIASRATARKGKSVKGGRTVSQTKAVRVA